MSYMQFLQKCESCGEEWNAAFGIIGTAKIAEPPTQCPKCGSRELKKIAGSPEEQDSVTLEVKRYDLEQGSGWDAGGAYMAETAHDGDYVRSEDYDILREQLKEAQKDLNYERMENYKLDKQLAACGNYVADRVEAPEWVCFINGRTVGIAYPPNQRPHLVVSWRREGEERLRILAAAEDDAGCINIGDPREAVDLTNTQEDK